MSKTVDNLAGLVHGSSEIMEGYNNMEVQESEIDREVDKLLVKLGYKSAAGVVLERDKVQPAEDKDNKRK